MYSFVHPRRDSVTHLQAVTRAVRLVHGLLQHQGLIVVVPRVVRVLASAPRARRHLRVTARGEVTKCDGNEITASSTGEADDRSLPPWYPVASARRRKAHRKPIRLSTPPPQSAPRLRACTPPSRVRPPRRDPHARGFRSAPRCDRRPRQTPNTHADNERFRAVHDHQRHARDAGGGARIRA